MRYPLVLAIFALASATAHAALFTGLSRLEKPKKTPRGPIEMAVLVKEPKRLEPELPPPQPKRPPKPVVAPTAALPAASPPTPAAPPPPPTFGISLSSTAQGGSFQVAVGNTVMKEPEKTPSFETRPYLAPVSAVSKLPKKLGECVADYPERARAEGREGQVILDVEIGVDGKVALVRVIDGIDAELDRAASEALRRCRFSPAEMSGAPVATRIRYTYTFVIEG